jgi:hypothetical protein
MVSDFVLDLAKATKPKKVNSVKHSRIINTFANDTIHYESSKFEFISLFNHAIGETFFSYQCWAFFEDFKKQDITRPSPVVLYVFMYNFAYSTQS